MDSKSLKRKWGRDMTQMLGYETRNPSGDGSGHGLTLRCWRLSVAKEHFIVVPFHRCFRLKLLGYPKDSCSRVGLTQLYKHLERSLKLIQWSTPNGLMVADLSAMRCCQIRRETPHDIPTMSSIFHDPIKTTLDMTWGDYASCIPILHLQPPITINILNFTIRIKNFSDLVWMQFLGSSLD